MPLPTFTFAQCVTQMRNTVANSTTKLNNFTSGSIVYAMLQAIAGNAMGLQQLLVHVSNITRLATCTGTDIDSFVADYGLTRLPAVASLAQGATSLQLSRTTTGAVLNVLPGGIVQTQVNGVQYQVFGDTTQAAWNAADSVYQFGSSQSTILVSAVALVPGTGGNVLAGTLTQIVSGFAGVSSVTNPIDITNGNNGETDSALKIRFLKFISSLAKGTLNAVEEAIASVQAGLTYQVLDVEHFDLSPWPAGFTVVVDDGSGAISETLQNLVRSAVLAVKAAGIKFEVDAPINYTVNVTTTVVASAGYTHSSVASAVQAAVQAYINSLGVGNSVSYANLSNVIQSVQGVYSYASTQLNGVVGDVGVAVNQLARAGTITVS